MKTKSLILLLVLFFNLKNAFAQNYYNNWYFGQKAGLSFNSKNPISLSDSKMSSSEGCSSISDNLGNLLFYTDGVTIWNKSHDTMKNGHGLLGSGGSTQSALIVKQPGNRNLYFVFTSDAINVKSWDTTLTNNGVNYSIVDMDLDNGLGEVLVKNKPLINNSNEKLTAVNHKNGEDVWIATIKRFTDSIFIYKLSSSGLNEPVIYKNNGYRIGYGDGSLSHLANFLGIGQMKFSPKGKYLTYIERNYGNEDSSYIHFFDFNSENGKLSNHKRITVYQQYGGNSYNSIYGCEFSPNEEYLYVSHLFSPFGGIYQIPIKSIKHNINLKTISIKTNLKIENRRAYFYSLQLAPNGKIYCAMSYDSSLSVINNPDSFGLKSNFEYNAVKLSSMISFGLPNCVQSQIYFPAQIVADTSCLFDSSLISLKYIEAKKIEWDFGDGKSQQSYSNSIKHEFSDSGTFNISAKVSLPNGLDTLIKGSIYIVKNLKPNLGTDTIICPNTELHIADKNKNFTIPFYWNTIDTTRILKIRKAGEYILTYNHHHCELSDTLNVKIGITPKVFIGNDTAFCNIFSTNINAGNGFKQYKWNTGETNYNISVNNKGVYHVQVADSNNCEAADTININQLAPPKIHSFLDTLLCDKVILKVERINGMKYKWSNNDTGITTQVFTKGNYWVMAQYPFCNNMDSIFVNKMPKPEFSLGNDTFICNYILI